MIVTVTPNPSLDRTVRVDRLRRGFLHRGSAARVEPSGKGVNVAAALHGVGCAVTAVVPVGGSSGRELAELLVRLEVSFMPVPITGDVRTNLTLIEDDGTTTKVNEPGPTLAPEEVAELLAAARRAGSAGYWTAWCGSLPSGFAEAYLAEAIAGCRSAGGFVALDTSGTTLATVLAAAVPHLVKPNAGELGELVGCSLRTVGDVVAAAGELLDRGVETVLVSLGSDGAVLVDRSGAQYGRAPVERVVNTAGAGDAFLAGYLAAASRSPSAPQWTRLESALRFGASAVGRPGTVLDRPHDEIVVLREPVDPGLALRDEI